MGSPFNSNPFSPIKPVVCEKCKVCVPNPIIAGDEHLTWCDPCMTKGMSAVREKKQNLLADPSAGVPSPPSTTMNDDTSTHLPDLNEIVSDSLEGLFTPIRSQSPDGPRGMKDSPPSLTPPPTPPPTLAFPLTPLPTLIFPPQDLSDPNNNPLPEFINPWDLHIKPESVPEVSYQNEPNFNVPTTTQEMVGIGWSLTQAPVEFTSYGYPNDGFQEQYDLDQGLQEPQELQLPNHMLGEQRVPNYQEQHLAGQELQGQQQQQTPPAFSQSELGLKRPRQVKPFSCEACKKSKVKCVKDTAAACRRCANKGIACLVTKEDKRTNDTNRGELEAIVEKYRRLSALLFTALNIIKRQRADYNGMVGFPPDLDAPANVVRVRSFPDLDAHLNTGGRLRDVRQSKGAAEQTGIELIGCIYHLCKMAYMDCLSDADFYRWINEAQMGQFNYSSVCCEKSDNLLSIGRSIEWLIGRLQDPVEVISATITVISEQLGRIN